MNDTITLTRADLEKILDDFGEDIDQNSLAGTGHSVWDGMNLTEWINKRWPGKDKPDPKGCIYEVHGRCNFHLADSSLACVGLDACKKAEMLLGVKL